MVLKNAEEDMAFVLGIHHHGEYCALQTAYTEKFKQESIGYLALMENFRYTIENHFSSNNLLDHFNYKLRICKRGSQAIKIVGCNRNLWGKFAYLIALAKQKVRKTEPKKVDSTA